MSTLIPIGGARLEVWQGGAKDPAAPLICAAHPADAFNDGTVTLLAETALARVVCINLRGIGNSTPLTEGESYSLEAMVDDLEAVRQQLKLPPWLFWGMS